MADVPLEEIPGNASFRTLAPLAHCEGVATGPDGSLWAGDEQGRIHRIDPADGSVETVGAIGAWALGLALDAASNVYVCAYDAGAIVRLEPRTGSHETYRAGLRNPNWAVFDRDGGLYVSESGSEELGSSDGRVVRIAPGADVVEPVGTPPLSFANGMALSADGTLYVVESFTSRVLAIADGATGVYAELPGTIPDGLALDEEGGLIVAVYQPNRVLRIPPGGGGAETLLEDWTGQRLLTPTNASFFGPRLESLAIASLCGWSLSAVELPWRGQPLFYPAVAGT
jgi:sugar lactone lactonase YvrE